MATAVGDTPSAHWRPCKRLWALLMGGIVVTALYSSISGWRENHVFLINATDSLPNWAFLIRRGIVPKRGNYVFFDPQRNALVRRHFGAKPQMFGKIVYGMPGDVIGHRGPFVTINGRQVAHMKPRTRLGEPLTPGITGTIPSGCYYAGSPHLDGFDSRYAEIGLVCRRQIIGVGKPVL